VGDFCSRLIGLDLVGVDDGFLDLVQHGDGFLHFVRVTDGDGQWIVHHHQCGGSHEDFSASHSDDTCRRSGDAVNFDRDVVRIIHQHGVDLTCSDAVSAGRI